MGIQAAHMTIMQIKGFYNGSKTDFRFNANDLAVNATYVTIALNSKNLRYSQAALFLHYALNPKVETR